MLLSAICYIYLWNHLSLQKTFRRSVWVVPVLRLRTHTTTHNHTQPHTHTHTHTQREREREREREGERSHSHSREKICNDHAERMRLEKRDIKAHLPCSTKQKTHDRLLDIVVAENLRGNRRGELLVHLVVGAELLQFLREKKQH